jgi:hypothetical protein
MDGPLLAREEKRHADGPEVVVVEVDAPGRVGDDGTAGGGLDADEDFFEEDVHACYLC